MAKQTGSKSRTAPRDAADIAFCTCANLRKASRVVTQLYDSALQPVGLKATQFTLLAVVDRRGPISMTALAEALVMDRTTLTRNLKPLTAQHLVLVETQKDRRVRHVDLTDDGRMLLARAIPQWRRAQTRLVEGMGRARWDGFLDDLTATVGLAQGG